MNTDTPSAIYVHTYHLLREWLEGVTCENNLKLCMLVSNP